MKKIVLTSIIALSLTACGGGGGNDSSTSVVGTASSDVNVAAATNGATVTTSFNSATAPNTIDENETTTWISDPDTPLVINFGSINQIKSFEVTKADSGAVSLGTTPDFLIEFSANGTTYVRSAISTFNSSDIQCTSSTITNTTWRCEMNEYPVQYFRITSKNGLSFEFKEIKAISFK